MLTNVVYLSKKASVASRSRTGRAMCVSSEDGGAELRFIASAYVNYGLTIRQRQLGSQRHPWTLIIAGGDVVTMNASRQVLLGGSVASPTD